MKFRTRVRRLRRKLTAQNVLSLGLIALAAMLLLFQLGSIHTGLAPSEAQLPPVTELADRAWNEPLLLPYTVSQLITAVILPTAGYTATRLPSVLLGAATLFILYWVLVQWYGRRLAVFGILLFMTSASFLHVARIATPAIIYPFAMAVILSMAVWWHKNSRPRWLIYASSAIAGLLLYVPGALWLLLGLLIIERKHIIANIKQNTKDTAAANILGLLTLAPLVNYLVNDWQNIQYILGINGNINVSVFLHDIARVWQYFFVGGYDTPVYNVGMLPLLNIFIVLLFFVGVYLYSKHPKAARTKLLLYWGIATTLLIALPSAIHISFLLPVIFVLSVGGMGYLLHLWLSVFPRNPLARGFGIGLLAIVVSFSIVYNVANYFLAWSNNDQVQRTFSKRL